jgi:HSP20 family molecular chaperone IbpA
VRFLEEFFTETPETITYVDAEKSKLMIEFTILDVEKTAINFMISENGCYLSAPSDNTLYAATLSFLCPVQPAEAKAIYEDGYLKVEIPLKEDIQNFIKVPVE